MRATTRLVLLAFLSLFLASCGGGGSGTVTDNNINSTNSTPTIPVEAGKMSLTSSNISHAGELFRLELYTPIALFDGIRANYDLIPIFNFTNGTETQNCAQGGSVTITVAEGGASLSRRFSNCFVGNGLHINGDYSYTITEVNQAAQSYTMNITFNRYGITGNGESLVYTGTTRIGARFDNQRVFLDVDSRRSIDSSEVGQPFKSNPLTYSVNYSASDTSVLNIDTVNGIIEMANDGAIDYAWDTSQQRVVVTGKGAAKGYLKIDSEYYTLDFVDASGQLGGTRALNGEPYDVFGSNQAPEFIQYGSMQVRSDTATPLHHDNWFRDNNLDLLDVTINVVQAPENADFELQPQNGFITLLAKTAGDYTFKLRAVDPDGLSAEGVINIHVVKDTDGDGVIDSRDDDDDGDGVRDEDDQFPLDSSESVDTDGDGIGNNADTDDDNDNVIDTVDLFPLDPQCSDASQSIGGRCVAVVAAESKELAVDKAAGILYILAKNENAIVRWNVADQEYMSSITLGGATPSTSTAVQMTISEAHDRVYIGYDTGSITYLDLKGGSETSLVNLPLSIGGLASVGEFILAQDGSGAWNTHYIIASDGAIKDQKEWNEYSEVYRWDAQHSRVYYFSSGSPRDLHYEVVDQTTGEITSMEETPYHGDYTIVPPIIVAESDGTVLIGSGNLFSKESLNWVGAVPGDIVDGIWSSDGLILIRTVGGKTVLERRSHDLRVVEQVEFSGLGKSLIRTYAGYTVLTVENNGLLAFKYTPSNDTDGDSVANIDDAFPLDAAASLDTDRDGYPDVWNAGYGQSDSSTGLLLDAYPEDSACYLASQGDGEHCDYAKVIPIFTPDQALSGDDGTIYLLSSNNNRVYRWSPTARNYVSPLVVGEVTPIGNISPGLMTYSPEHNRLYFGYDSGQINYIDLSDIASGEQPFTTVATKVGGLASVGNFLLAQDDSGAWATHYVFSKTGDLTDSQDWNRYSRAYAWNSELSRVYFFSDGTSPNDIHYEEIDQSTGKINSAGESPYHGDYGISPPILVTPSNGILLGTGGIFNARSLEWKGSLSSSFEYAVVRSNGEILTIRALGGNTRLDRYNAGMSWVSEADFSGEPVGIFEQDGTAYVVTKTSEGLLFTQY